MRYAAAAQREYSLRARDSSFAPGANARPGRAGEQRVEALVARGRVVLDQQVGKLLVTSGRPLFGSRQMLVTNVDGKPREL
jgi:hypothetical protein